MKFISSLLIFVFAVSLANAQITTFAKVDHLIPDGVDTQGGISLNVSGSTPPYTYSWNSGAYTTQNISGVAAGQYSLSVTTSSHSYSNVYDIGYKVMWTNNDRSVFRNDSLISTAPNTNIYGYAVSKNTLAANTNGWIEYVVDNVTGTNAYFLGFTDSISSNPNTYGDIDYGIYYTSTKQLYYYETGANAVIKAAPKVGDVVKIERIGNTINYKINNAVVRTQTVTGISQKVLKVKAALRSIPTQILNVGCSFSQLNNTTFINYMEHIPYIKHCRDNATPEGRVKVTPKIAASNTYLWQPGGATTQTIVNQSAGIKTVTISDNLANNSTYKYNVGYKADWTNMDRCAMVNDSLYTTVTSGIYGTAVTKNTLDANTDGWFEYVIDNMGVNNYYIGFVDNLASIQYGVGDIDYGIYYYAASKYLYYYETGTNAALYYAIRVGDVVRVERVGNNIIYKLNGVTLRTIAATAGFSQKALKIKAQMLNVNRLVNVGCSFDNKSNSNFNNYVRVIPTIKHASGLGATNGKVTLVPTIPYSNTYLWQPGGATTSSVSSLGAATYSVTVSDGAQNQSTYNYNVGYKVIWTNLDRCNSGTTGDSLINPVNNGNIIGTAISKNTLTPGVDGWIEYVIDPTAVNQHFLGFTDSINHAQYTATDICFGVHYSGGILEYYEQSTGTATIDGHLRAGDIVRIERVGDNINYKVNGYQLRTVNVPGVSQRTFKVKANIYSLNKLVNVGCSFVESGNMYFANYVKVKPEVTHNSSMGITNGQIKVTPYVPYSNTYNWQPGGSTQNTISNVAPGTYSITTYDAVQTRSNVKYNVGYKMNWMNLYNASISGDTLKGTTTGTGSANSRDTLPANTNGWIEYIYTEPSKSFYFGFLDVLSANQATASDIDFGFYQTTTAIVNQYEGGTSTAYTYNQRLGDVFRIERCGDTIKYSFNGRVSRTTVSAGLAAKPLLVKALVLNKANLTKFGASFTACKFTTNIATNNLMPVLSCSSPTLSLRASTTAPTGSTYLWSPGNATTATINVSDIGCYTFFPAQWDPKLGIHVT